MKVSESKVTLPVAKAQRQIGALRSGLPSGFYYFPFFTSHALE